MTANLESKTELRFKIINTGIATLGGLGMIVSIWFGFHQLSLDAESQRRQTFFDERMEVYSRATEAAAHIAALKRADDEHSQYSEAVIDFQTLFWGPMAITEGKEVEAAMFLFNEGIKNNLGAEALEQLALHLAHICRNEAHAHYFDEDAPASRYGSSEEILEKMEGYLEQGLQRRIASEGIQETATQ